MENHQVFLNTRPAAAAERVLWNILFQVQTNSSSFGSDANLTTEEWMASFKLFIFCKPKRCLHFSWKQKKGRAKIISLFYTIFHYKSLLLPLLLVMELLLLHLIKPDHCLHIVQFVALMTFFCFINKQVQSLSPVHSQSRRRSLHHFLFLFFCCVATLKPNTRSIRTTDHNTAI